jgi:cytochrome c biogenesis protein CcmG/thiol:disulfide interchange protein DsbE
LPLLLALLLAGCDRGTHPQMIGRPAPNFTVTDSDRTVTLSSLRGRVVVLNFWGTWCPPCVEEMPSLVRLQQQAGDRIVVFGVSIDENADAYHRFLIDYHINFLTVRDGNKSSSTLYGTFGWPETYIIDSKGILRRKFVGAVDWTSPDILEYLRSVS